MIIDNYSWSNRLLIMITDEGENKLEKCVKEFFCAIRIRNQRQKIKTASFFC